MATNVELQKQLGKFGLLDPEYDGKWGVESALALRTYRELVDMEDAETDRVVDRLMQDKDPIPLKLGDDLASKVIRAALDEGFYVAKSSGHYNLLYGEDMDAEGKILPEQPDKFNDRCFLIEIHNNGVPKMIGNWTATTEPGVYWTTSSDRHPKGAARIALKQFKAWGIGLHRGKYEALVQTDDVIVFRDRNQDYSRDGDLQYEGVFGINHHHGGNSPTIGRYSAGCSVIQSVSSHFQRMALLKSDKRYQNKKAYKFMAGYMTGQTIMKNKQLVAA